MYNRYIRNDSGAYTRTVQPDGPAGRPPAPPSDPPPAPSKSPPEVKGGEMHRLPTPGRRTEMGFFNQILEKLHLGDLDAGDLLLLLILFLLFEEKADEELLIAIGLLLIL